MSKPPPSTVISFTGKTVRRSKKYRAHDENNSCRAGDKVELVASKPYSKTKRWRVVRTIEKAREQL